MTDLPKDFRILQAMQAQLAKITIENGFSRTIPLASIYIGKTVIGNNVERPCLTILESTRPDAQPYEFGEENPDQSINWPLLVQGFIDPEDSVSITDLTRYYLFKADVMKALGRTKLRAANRTTPLYPDEYRLGNLVSNIQIGPGIVTGPRPDANGGMNGAMFYLPVTVNYVMDTTDPYK